VNSLLISMRQLTIIAANEGANDDKMLAADQFEITNALDTVDRIARSSQFGSRTLLDGSNGANGVAVGPGLSFVSAAPITRNSPAEGYAINITRAATRAEQRGARPIELSDLTQPFQLLVSEGGRTVKFSMEDAKDSEPVRQTLADLRSFPAQVDRPEAERALREIIAQTLQRKADEVGMPVEVFIDRSEDPRSAGVLVVRHREFGGTPRFHVGSSVPGVLATQADRFEESVPGRDVEGTMDGKIAHGQGERLRGPQSTEVEGLVVEHKALRREVIRLPRRTGTTWSEIKEFFSGSAPANRVTNPALLELLQQLRESGVRIEQARLVSQKEERDEVVFTFEVPTDVSAPVDGFVHVSQNSLAFQVGPTRGQQVKISLIDANSDRLARGLENDSGFRSLREIDVTHSQGAQDALLLLDEAITQIAVLRADLGAFQKNTLQSNANSLRVSEENLTSAESSLRDADMAAEVSQFTRNQIMLASGMAMLAQANQTPQTVLQLLTNRQQ
jgi:flagellin